MRIPSRRMPKLESGPTTCSEWCVLIVLLGGFTWLLVVLVLGLIGNPVLWIPVGGVMLLVFALSIRDQLRLGKLASDRTDDIGSFARALDFRNIDPWIIRAVHEETNSHLPKKLTPFPLRVSDTFESLGLDEDIDDIGICAAERAGYDVDDLEGNPHIDSITTLGDLIVCIQAQPRTGERRSH